MARTKSEIDKESMFNKIMPSNLIRKNSEDSQAPEFDEEATSLQQTVTKPQISLHQSNVESTTINPTKTPLYSMEDKKNSFVKRKSTVMVNIIEQLVASKLDMAFNKFNCCKCDRCRQDVAALALNKIKPKYIIVDENEAKDVLNNHDDPTVMSAIIQAMLTVMSHPRH